MPTSKHRREKRNAKQRTPRRPRQNLKKGTVLSIDRFLATSLTESRKNMKPCFYENGELVNPNGTLGRSDVMKLAKENMYDS